MITDGVINVKRYYLHLLRRGDAKKPQAVFERAARRISECDLVCRSSSAIEDLLVGVPSVEGRREFEKIVREKVRLQFSRGIFHRFRKTVKEARELGRLCACINFRRDVLLARFFDYGMRASMRILQIRPRIAFKR